MTVPSAIHLLSNHTTLEVQNNQLVEASISERIKRFFSADYDKVQINHIATFIKQLVERDDLTQAKENSIKLADAFIISNATSKRGRFISQVFDRTIAPHRSTIEFFHPSNQEAFKKWQRYEMPPEIFQKYPQFCQFMETSGLLSQMKVTNDKPSEKNGAVGLIVDGQWMNESVIQKNFEVVYSPQFREKFIYHKHKNEVYTYLGNGLGLQPHHPYLTEMNPVSLLTDDEHAKVLQKAHQFVRPGEESLSEEQRAKINKDRTFVIQIVTSKVKGPNTNVHDLLQNRKHPYLRLVIGESNKALKTAKGQVYEVGYGWKNKVSIPFIASQGRFRSPDIWEYTPCEERVVTNIPVTRTEARDVQGYTLGYHRRGIQLGQSIGFHLARQNCSTYVRMALAVAGVAIPTQISLKETLARISPNWVKSILNGYQCFKKKTKELGSYLFSIFPKKIVSAGAYTAYVVNKLTRRVIDGLAAFSLVPLTFLLGGASGKGGVAFVAKDEIQKEIKPTLLSSKKWFSLSNYYFNLPGVLQDWQFEQQSTVVYTNPIKLAILPLE